MGQIPTVKITHARDRAGYAIINLSDFDPARDTRWEDRERKAEVMAELTVRGAAFTPSSGLAALERLLGDLTAAEAPPRITAEAVATMDRPAMLKALAALSPEPINARVTNDVLRAALLAAIEPAQAPEPVVGQGGAPGEGGDTPTT